MKILRSLLAMAVLAMAAPVSHVALAQKAMCNMPSASMAAKPSAAAPVDINSATKAQLMAIPGIGDKYSDAIVKGRPYANKAQLTSRGILPAAVYSKVSPMIIAKQKK